ncbi:MAG TPA: hypothetical protein DHT34_06320 [Cellvibrionales bacterium]|jgi:D-sedoheptulose 7-phosphate isomerase|nr:hypothetical protein [Gammaproteobacteria bacterium]HCX27303.1 hypothetical protein [Cellvibrionales bacterium]
MSTDNPFITERIAAAMQNLGGLPVELPNAIIDAGVHIAGQLVQEHKVIAVGIDSFAPLAQMFCNNLMYRDAELRPALPALSLNSDASGVAMAAAHENADALYSRPLKSIGKNGDVLLLLCQDLNSAIAATTLATAKANGMTAIIIGANSEQLTIKNDTQTLSLLLEEADLTRMHEISLFILNCLNDIIDEQLFGTH